MSTDTVKISIKIWQKVAERLEEKLDLACLRRDAFINRLLEIELPELDDENQPENSEDARKFISRRLNGLERKQLSLSLRSDIVEYLDNICAKKRIVRDAFFNRLFFLLAVSPKVIDELFFGGDDQWRSNVWSVHRNEGPAFNNTFYPLEPEINPFWAIRVGLEEDGQESIYGIIFDDNRFPGADLYGLNCYLSDKEIPGNQTDSGTRKSLDELLAESA